MSSSNLEQLKQDIKTKDPRCTMEVPSLKEINSTLLYRVKEELTADEFSRLNKTKIFNAAKDYLKAFKKLGKTDFLFEVIEWTEDLDRIREEKQSYADIVQFLLMGIYSEVTSERGFIYLGEIHVDGVVDKLWKGIEVPELYSTLFSAICDANVLRAKTIAKEDVRPDFDPELHVGSIRRTSIDKMNVPVKLCNGPCQICSPSSAAEQQGKGETAAQEGAKPAKERKLYAAASAFTPKSVARAFSQM